MIKYYLSMNQTEFVNMKEDIIKLFTGLCERYPNDLEIKSALDNFYGNHIQPIDGKNNNSGIITDLKVVRNKKSHEEKIKEIEEKLNESFIDRDIIEDNLLTSNTIECLRSMKIIALTIKTSGKKLLIEYGRCGEILQKLKIFEPTRFHVLLKKNDIPFKMNYINFLIRLYALMDKHQKLLQSSLSIHFIKKNLAIITEICVKNNW